MGLFHNDTKTLKEYCDQYGLTELEPKDLDIIEEVLELTAGQDFVRNALSIVSAPEEPAKLGSLKALVAQQWILIRQMQTLNETLSRIADRLED